MIKLRCSDLPLAMACPAAVLDGGLRVDPVNPAAAVGSAAHDALRALVEQGAIEWERIGEIAANHGADVEEVRMLCAQGTRAWREIGGYFRSPETEVALAATLGNGRVRLTGHLDVSALEGAVADWKCGRVDASYREQLLAYAALRLLDDPELREAHAFVVWVREGEVERHDLRRADLAAWEERIVAALSEWDGEYHPGPQCRHCPRAHDCPAATALARRDVAVVAGFCEPVDLSQLDAEALLDLHERTARVGDMSDRLKAALKAEVSARDGLVAAKGRSLIIETIAKREIDPLAAWPVLEAAGFGDTDFAACMTLGVGKVESRVAEKAGRGKGAGAVRALGEQLEAAGALRRKTTDILKARRSA